MKKTMAKNCAVIYARFSSHMQREESIDAQLRACRKYAEDNGIRIIGEYIDRAKSATSDQRPQFQNMIKDSKNREFDIVLVHKLNRFSRDRYDSAIYKRALRKNGVRVHSVMERIDDSPQSILIEGIHEAMAEYDIRNLAHEVEKGKRENALKAIHVGGRPPLGYDVDPVTRKLVVNPVEAEAVKLIFSWYLDGYSYGEIVSELNRRGCKTKRGQSFVTNSLHDILKNPKYMGDYVYSRTAPKSVDHTYNRHRYKDEEDIIRVPGAVPPLVSREDFEQVQKRMESRKRQPASYRAKHSYLLTGKVICGTCGKAYVGNCRKANKDHPEYLSYRCNNRTKRPRCSGWEIGKGFLESIVLGELANVVFNDELIPKFLKQYDKHLAQESGEEAALCDALKAQIADLRKQMDNIIDVIARTASDALVGKLNELDASKKELEGRLREITVVQEETPGITEEDLRKSFQQAREMLKSGRLSTVRALVERYVRQVVIRGENIEIQFNLHVGDRVVEYHPATYGQKKTPQIPPRVSAAFSTVAKPFWLAIHGGEGGTRIFAFPKRLIKSQPIAFRQTAWLCGLFAFMNNSLQMREML